MSKLEDTDCEINGGDVEDNGYSFLSELEENADSSDDDQSIYGDETAPNGANPKEFRDLAEGKNLNNSFVGSSYPENWDHLHLDKGANP